MQTTLPLSESVEGRSLAATSSSVSRAVSRSSGVYGAHAYHTKIPPEAIQPYLLEYTRPGASVIDPFCGSGMTGVAARRTGRHAILSDLSPAAVHIAANYTTPCEPATYARAVERLASSCQAIRNSLYSTHCHSCGGLGVTAYVIWSDVRKCPHCDSFAN